MIDSSASAASRGLWLAVAGSALILVASYALEWLLSDWVKPFVRALAWILALGTFSIAIAHARIRKPSTWSPALICIVAGAFSLFAPFERWGLSADFHSRLAARQAVIAAVGAGSLTPNVAHSKDLIALHDRPQVSAGGNEIIVERHYGKDYVFFYTSKGPRGRYDGFLWVGANGDPQEFRAGVRSGARIEGMTDEFGKGWWYQITNR